MHEYYKKKRDKLKKTMKGFLALVSTELESTASKAYSEVVSLCKSPGNDGLSLA